MNSEREARHRLGIARQLLGEAQQDADMARWRSCAANSQQAVEHAAKSVLVCYGPVPRTHDVHANLRRLMRTITAATPMVIERVEQLSEIAKAYGREQHMRVTYGDEDALVSPYELIDEAEARQSVADAREACELARQIIEARFPASE